MLNTIYNYFTSSYQPKLAHFPSHKIGVNEVKSKHNVMMNLFAIFILHLTYFLALK
jgi:hypothetical protein